MSDDEVDLELLDLLRQRMGLTTVTQDEISSDTGVLRDAEYIYNNSIDVFINMHGTKAAAEAIYQSMQQRAYSTETWSHHELHPGVNEGFSEVDLVNFVFTMDLLNFSFWSELGELERYQVEYRGKRWTGYNSLVACLRRALDEGIPITTPRFWRSRECTDHVIAEVFRGATDEQIPLLEGRISNLREASAVLSEVFPDLNDEQYDDHSTGLEYDSVTRKTDPVAQATTKGGQVPRPQNYNGSVEKETTPWRLASDIEQPQPQPDADGGESLDPEVATNTGMAADSLSAHVQTDASTSLPHTPASPCESIEMPPRSRQKNVAPDRAVVRLIESASRSAGRLVNLLAMHFPSCFRDEARFDGRRVKLMKRAQIFVADLWAALNARGLGAFIDIDHLTMFPDYRVAQMLHGLGVLSYSPPLDHRIKSSMTIESGHSWEVQIRGCSIWAVELLRREILSRHQDTHVNAVLLDFFLYDLAKEREANADNPHHRTRSIWY